MKSDAEMAETAATSTTVGEKQIYWIDSFFGTAPQNALMSSSTSNLVTPTIPAWPNGSWLVPPPIPQIGQFEATSDAECQAVEIHRPMTLAEAINFVAGLTESKDTIRVQLEGGMILRWDDCVDSEAAV